MGEREGGSEGGGWRSGPRGDRRSWLQKCFRVLVLREMNDARCIMAVLWKIKKRKNSRTGNSSSVLDSAVTEYRFVAY